MNIYIINNEVIDKFNLWKGIKDWILKINLIQMFIYH